MLRRWWASAGAEPDAHFKRLSGRGIGWLLVGSGAATAAYAPTSGDARMVMVLITGLGMAAGGAVALRLPWHRWLRRRSMWAIVPAIAVGAFGNWIDPNPYLAGISLVLAAMWVGVAMPRGTMLLLFPLFTVAYWFPFTLVPHAAGLEGSAAVFTVTCVLAGESTAWLTTQLFRAQARLREHDERRFQALVAASSDTTILLDRQGCVAYVSPSIESLLGRSAAEVQGYDVRVLVDQFVAPGDAATLRAQLSALDARPGSTGLFRFQVTHATAGLRDVEGVGRNLATDEAVAGILINVRDVSKRVELERALTRQACFDQLTGLPNRRSLREQLAAAVSAAAGSGGGVALLLADLNRFEDINDTLGHEYGDRLLRQVAERLAGNLRQSDTVARLGGDEFAVLLPSVENRDDAVAVTAKLCAALDEPFLLNDLVVAVDAGFGLAVYPDHAIDPDELLRKADIAMYAAKRARLDYQIFEPDLDRHSARKLALLGQIRSGIAENQFVLHYQPKIDARTGRLAGTEALARWQQPDHQLLAPADFIPLAEATGLIRPLTLHLLQLALRQQRCWQQAGIDFCVAVNISAHCLLDPTLPEQVDRLLREAGVPPASLALEVTESAVMSDPARAMDILFELHALGVRLSIDDFGTGYSSMDRLTSLPVQELKVDRSFVKSLCESPNALVVARSIIDLGHNLGLEVVGEGVEDEGTWSVLKLLGCDMVQGYLVAKPMPADELSRWLSEWQPKALNDRLGAAPDLGDRVASEAEDRGLPRS